MKQKSQKIREAEFRFQSVLEKSNNRLWGAHLQVPAHVIRKLGNETSRRVVCQLNGAVEYQTALLPVGDGICVVRVNKKLRDSLGLRVGAEVTVRLQRDESNYGLPMPAELAELLEQDPDGQAFFQALTKGRQRTLLYIIGSVQNDSKRADRAVTVLKHLKTNKGKIDYRELYRLLRSKSIQGM